MILNLKSDGSKSESNSYNVYIYIYNIYNNYMYCHMYTHNYIIKCIHTRECNYWNCNY